MVGPNFKAPAKPPIFSYTKNPLPKNTAKGVTKKDSSQSQKFNLNEPITDKWWEKFSSAKLNYLISRGLANNADLKSAYANLRIAQETLNAEVGNALFPAVDLGLLKSRQRTNTSSVAGTSSIGSTVFNIYNASVNITYTLDLFGGARRQLEQLQALVDYQQFQLIAAHNTLIANILTTTITAASLREQIEEIIKLIKSQQSQLTILQNQFKLGGIAEAPVLTQATLLAQTRALLPVLQKQLANNEHALAVLIGTFPNEPLPALKFAEITLPKEIPVSFPANLVRQRPDVRAQEALLHAATAQIGVATANLLPQFNLSGNIGYQSAIASQLFQKNSKIWNATYQLTQPLFHGGALFALRREAIASYDFAKYQYRTAVLQAYQDVANVLRALETDARQLRAEEQAEISASRNLNLLQRQFKLGGISYLEMLNAQQQYRNAVIARIKAEENRYNDTAALFVALGGGWWNKKWCVTECL